MTAAFRRARAPRRRAQPRVHLARITLLVLTAALATAWPTASRVSAQREYRLFESDPVRPMALSTDGSTLYVVNTPDARLEVFDVGVTGLTHTRSVRVGLEPVAVALAPDGRVWVVNHLSDSVSVLSNAGGTLHVTHTLWVGDEPRDVVFAGAPGAERAFITTAHRGQHSPYPSGEPNTPGIGRADVWVFDALAASPGAGGPQQIVTLFGDRPRALAVSPDGTEVYAAVFRSGNQTTTVTEGVVCDGATNGTCSFASVTYPGGLPSPRGNHSGAPGPEVGLIVRYDQGSDEWHDELGRDWSPAVRFELPDYDVFALDADAAVGAVDVTRQIAGVGTVLFNMVVHPTTGRLFVTNTEAHNEVRFEGPGTFVRDNMLKPPGVPASVRGHLHEARVTVVDGTTATPHHLNPHIPYETTPMPADVGPRSFATPMGAAISADGATLYVAAFGSGAVAVIDVAELEAGTFTPTVDDRITVSGGGPTGVVLDPTGSVAFVTTRFDNGVSVLSLGDGTEQSHVLLHNPEPTSVVDGRRFLYDAQLTSSNGEASCGSCHVFGDMDDLAWDLGDPDGNVTSSFNPVVAIGNQLPFHPLKGPMTTQSLRGLMHVGPMHWRGDRTGATGANPDGAFDEGAAFRAFNVAFGGLVGRDEGPLSEADMQAFTDFALQLTYPPNPARSLDNTLSAAGARGLTTFMTRNVDPAATCNGCHAYDRAQGFFGSGGRTTFENETQEFKVAHLRNLYQKVGMFGMPNTTFLAPIDATLTGPQVRGFGYLHDGSIDTVEHFFHASVFSFRNTGERADVVELMMEFDSDLAPAVGQQVSVGPGADVSATQRLALLRARADATQLEPGGVMGRECDLIASALTSTGEERGYVWDAPLGQWQSDRLGELLSHTAMLDLTEESVVTFTCMPPRTGYRAGVDRDGDFALDGDERDRGTDPLDPSSFPADLLMDAGGPPTPDMGTVDMAMIDMGAPDGGPGRTGGGGCGCRVGDERTAERAPAGLLSVLVVALVGRRRRRA
ncbi:MAG: SMP-30/gluconolactonase/LRE family protein [Myxococcales bacterium]|nr:SMP-30/gluconolactonase/LRE family protein [Myxococcales bacterium]